MRNKQETESLQRKDQGISVSPSSALCNIYKSGYVLDFIIIILCVSFPTPLGVGS